MRNVLAICCFLGLLSGSGWAQERHKPRAGGHFFFAPGQRHDTGSSTLQIGGGGEGYVYKGLGFGGDVGALNVQSTTGVRQWTSMVSLNALYHFNSADKSRFSPFIIGGVTVIPAFDVPGGVNIGGGLQYWFRDRIGLRIEFRDHILTGMRNHHYPQARIAIAFRRSDRK
jgi:hypothetical protein